MYWPSMTAELKEYISQCETCSKYEVRQQRESLMSHEIAERPWEKIGTDLYTISGQDNLIIVDFSQISGKSTTFLTQQPALS